MFPSVFFMSQGQSTPKILGDKLIPLWTNDPNNEFDIKKTYYWVDKCLPFHMEFHWEFGLRTTQKLPIELESSQSPYLAMNSSRLFGRWIYDLDFVANRNL